MQRLNQTLADVGWALQRGKLVPLKQEEGSIIKAAFRMLRRKKRNRFVHFRLSCVTPQPDKPTVRELYKRLVAEGIDAWLDEKKLLAGQDWELEIRRERCAPAM